MTEARLPSCERSTISWLVKVMNSCTLQAHGAARTRTPLRGGGTGQPRPSPTAPSPPTLSLRARPELSQVRKLPRARALPGRLLHNPLFFLLFCFVFSPRNKIEAKRHKQAEINLLCPGSSHNAPGGKLQHWGLPEGLPLWPRGRADKFSSSPLLVAAPKPRGKQLLRPCLAARPPEPPPLAPSPHTLSHGGVFRIPSLQHCPQHQPCPAKPWQGAEKRPGAAARSPWPPPQVGGSWSWTPGGLSPMPPGEAMPWGCSVRTGAHGSPRPGSSRCRHRPAGSPGAGSGA